jgi:dipeptidyl-peptidase-4
LKALLFSFIGAILLVAGSPCAWAAKKPITIDTVMQSGERRHSGATVTWAPNGIQFVVNSRGTLVLYDVPTGKQRDIVTLQTLETAAEHAPEPPVFDWTNRRVGESDFQWFSDNKRLLVSAGGDLFVVNVANGAFEQLTKTPEVEHDPKLSPDNKSVAFRHGSNLFVMDIPSKKITQLTHDGSDTLLNGQLDWVYPEELDLDTAYWWSPDSQSIAYMQFDVSREPVFPQVSLLSRHAVLEPQRFPQPGDPNADVHIGIVPASGGSTRWMDLGNSRGSLFARVVWLPDSRHIAVEKLPRIQNKLDLLIADKETGISRVAVHEEDPSWVNVEGEPEFLSGGERFLWTSERSGFRHIYLYSVDGELQKQLTSGDWEVNQIAHVDEKSSRVFYVSNEDSPLKEQLYEVGLDGSGKRRLSDGTGTHTVSISPTAAYYLDNFSGLTAQPRGTLYKCDGSEVRVYRKPDTSDADEYDILPTEIVQVKASDGTTLYARLIKPAGFEPGKKYPAVIMVYGGPGVQLIHDSWQGVSWDQVLAHKGFVIWQLDNRGSSGRGHKFESAIYHDLGRHELEDQKTGIQYLTKTGFVDPNRLGMYGWSYGGYMTLYTLTNAPGLIKAGISGAPVTSWLNYDSIYTERYMGLPDENAQAYKTSSPTSTAANLASKLLIVHNVEDDNVHFQNSVQMANELEKANKLFCMLMFPQKSHGVTGAERRQLLEQTTKFFEDNLK